MRLPWGPKIDHAACIASARVRRLISQLTLVTGGSHKSRSTSPLTIRALGNSPHTRQGGLAVFSTGPFFLQGPFFHTNSRMISSRGEGIVTFSTSKPFSSITAAPAWTAASTEAMSPVKVTNSFAPNCHSLGESRSNPLALPSLPCRLLQ
jgi:hypothetical protein